MARRGPDSAGLTSAAGTGTPVPEGEATVRAVVDGEDVHDLERLVVLMLGHETPPPSRRASGTELQGPTGVPPGA